MITVAVGQQNQIYAFQCGQFVVALVEARIGQPGIDQQNVAGRRDKFKCGVSVEGELSIRNTEDETEKAWPSQRNERSEHDQPRSTKGSTKENAYVTDSFTLSLRMSQLVIF